MILDLGNLATLELVLIPAGKFMMGSPESDMNRNADEGPQHEVTISRQFYVSKYQVTQAQYQAVMGNNPSYFPDDLRRPVECVSWYDAQEFCRKLGQMTGKIVRLPTEAEWEYACRAGTTTQFYTGDKEEDLVAAAWFGYDKSDRKTHPVGLKKPNAWGLYDIHGNGWEWCQDYYGADYYKHSPQVDPKGPETGEYRVLRGGSWHGSAAGCRSAVRRGINPNSHYFNGGFRIMVEV
jgi:formylglycine-generating enzyme required for sulfatase activity